MLVALARHDFGTVYRALEQDGTYQIARRTGQSQSEISDIVLKGRDVGHYDVLMRICKDLQLLDTLEIRPGSDARELARMARKVVATRV